MGSLADGKFRRDGEFRIWGFLHIGSSGVKIQGFNPDSFLRSTVAKAQDTKDIAKQRLVCNSKFNAIMRVFPVLA